MTAKPKPTKPIPCPACGMVDDCPHTPVRCNHNWNWNSGHQANAPGALRTCLACGRVERVVLRFETVLP